ncbi:toll/interleukin-1 receptor domain-containing protein [Curtobacterium flaccumfaciens pv. flaccumfaciens]|uniref:toll/interleukin-1 receptor domain-containing protein n=1 Tax=Curtobacterium flaccumfaciens TaxID=2035 RepID=UPI003992BD63
MTVFISWSGDQSRAVADVFREWFPKIIQGLPVFMSEQDIPTGTRWYQEIATQLEGSSYGVICVTPENEDAPWLNFEAGAIGKVTDGTHVSPVAISMSKEALSGPLSGFNAVNLDKVGMMTLLESINSTQGQVPWEHIKASAEAFWPEMEKALSDRPRGTTPEPAFDSDEALIEVRTLVRTLVDFAAREATFDRTTTTNTYKRSQQQRRHFDAELPSDSSLGSIRVFLEAHKDGDPRAGEALSALGLDPDQKSLLLDVARERVEAAKQFLAPAAAVSSPATPTPKQSENSEPATVEDEEGSGK